MKIGELREQLSKLKKEEIIKIASEFYKLIPKHKKEDYQVDSFVTNPSKKKTKSASKDKLSLLEVEKEVKFFIENAREQNYIFPNNVVPKKERPKWRFKVKRLYKELINQKRADKNLSKQAALLCELYELICESCGYQYFSGYDSFQSIGIEQTDFFTSTITLLHEAEGKANTIEKSIKLIVDNYLNRYTLYSGLMEILIATYEIPDLKYSAIEITKKLITQNGFVPKPESKKRKYITFFADNNDFKQKEKNNNLAKLGFRLYISLFEAENGIEFYKEHYYHKHDEVKLYILIDILLHNRKKDLIVTEIEKAIEQGIEPRDKLIKLLNTIKKSGKLSNYM